MVVVEKQQDNPRTTKTTRVGCGDGRPSNTTFFNLAGWEAAMTSTINGMLHQHTSVTNGHHCAVRALRSFCFHSDPGL
jgi:hypothetical protein